MFSIELGEDGNVRLNGRLDAAQCAKAEEFLGTVDGPSTLDFAQLEYISSAGLGILLKTQKRLVEKGAGLKIINLNNQIINYLNNNIFTKIT